MCASCVVVLSHEQSDLTGVHLVVRRVCFLSGCDNH